MSLLDMDRVLAQTAKAVEQMNQPASPGEATREFYREQGRQQEQERIIKLLEELKGDQEGCCDECKPHLENSRNYLTAVIALIKGDNK